MRTLYLECKMGAAGDMIMSALSELLDRQDDFLMRLNSIGLKDVSITKMKSVKCGITGTHVNVMVNGIQEISKDMNVHDHHDHDHHHHDHEHHDYKHHHHHNGIGEITRIIENLNVSQNVKNNASAIYNLIAEAESKAHGKPVSLVHFHEVGAMDAVADIVGVCMLMEEIRPERIIVSPICLGSGFVHCAHGVLPVPAPATAYILQGVPTYAGNLKAELCTPTGAAILKHFADEFSEMPVMITEKIGYGMGEKDFETANCVRAFLGETEERSVNGEIAELRCNLDDMTGEKIAFAIDILFENNALDVFTTPVQMKKSRPGVLLSCICKTEDANFMASLILKHTSTFGIRKTICERYTLDREFDTVSTRFGEIRRKTGTGFGIKKSKLEYEDVAGLAKKYDVNLDTIYNGSGENL